MRCWGCVATRLMGPDPLCRRAPCSPAHCSPQRWLTSALLHQSFVHLLSNSLMLAGFSLQLERKHGTWRVAALAVLAALAGNLLRCVGRGCGGGCWSSACFPPLASNALQLPRSANRPPNMPACLPPPAAP